MRSQLLHFVGSVNGAAVSEKARAGRVLAGLTAICIALDPTCGSMTSVTPWQTITGSQKSCGGGAWPSCQSYGNNAYAIQVPAQTAEMSWAACIARDSLYQQIGPNLELCPSQGSTRWGKKESWATFGVTFVL